MLNVNSHYFKYSNFWNSVNNNQKSCRGGNFCWKEIQRKRRFVIGMEWEMAKFGIEVAKMIAASIAFQDDILLTKRFSLGNLLYHCTRSISLMSPY